MHSRNLFDLIWYVGFCENYVQKLHFHLIILYQYVLNEAENGGS